MHAVILAAGKGTRLRPITDTLPKPLVDVCGKPLICHILDALPRNITNITIVVGYLGEQVQARVGKTYQGMSVKYVEQESLNGTGGALELLRRTIAEATLVVNADDIYAVHDLARLTQFPLAVLARRTNDTVANPFEVSNEHLLKGFLPKQGIVSGETYWQNCGAYMIDPRYFLEPAVEIPVRGSVEISAPHTLTALARHEKVHVVEATEWLPVGTPEELAHARSTMCNEGRRHVPLR